MIKRGFLLLFSFTLSAVAFGSAEANTDLVYGYYDVRGVSSYMAVNVTTAQDCIVKPTGEDIFFYDHLDATVPGTDPAKIRPIATTVDNHNVDITVDIGQFCEPMDLSFSMFVPVLNPEDIWFLGSSNTLSTLSDEAVGEGQSGSTDMSSNPQEGNRGSNHEQHGHHKKFKNLIFWKSEVLDVNQEFKGTVPSGLYVLTLGATPAGSDRESSYRWVTLFIVP